MWGMVHAARDYEPNLVIHATKVSVKQSMINEIISQTDEFATFYIL
jgi:hypothetical protein